MGEWEEGIYIFFWTKKMLPKSQTSTLHPLLFVSQGTTSILECGYCVKFCAPPQYRNDVNKLGQVRWRVTESVTGALWEGLVQPGEETILEYLRATPVPMRSVLQWQSQASVGASWWNAWETKGICWNKKDAEWLQGKAFCLLTVEQATKDFESLITTPRSKLSSLYFCSFISELCSLVGNVYFWIFLDRASTIHEQLPIDFKSALLCSEIYCDGYTSTLHVTDMSYTYIYLSHTYT